MESPFKVENYSEIEEENMISKIALVGKMRSGKDTVADILSDYGYAEYKLGSGIGDVVEMLFVDGKHGLSNRELYQKIGQQMRKIDSEVWIKKLLRRIEVNNPKLVVVSDVRQKNEEIALRAAGFTIVKVYADEGIRIDRIKNTPGEKFDIDAFNHETELSVDDIIADISIANNDRIPDLLEGIHKKLLNS